MGLRINLRNGTSIFFIFLLLLNQILFIGIISSKSIPYDNNLSFRNNNNNHFKPFDLSDTYYSCRYIFVVDDLLIAQSGYKKYFLDISKPSRPKEVTNIDYINGVSYVKLDNIVLFGLPHNMYDNSIMKIDLALNSTHSIEIDRWDYEIRKMQLTTDSLFSYVRNDSGWFKFLIHNATNIDNLTLLGTSTLSSLDPYDPYFNERDNFFVQENYVYFVQYNMKNLLVYEINSTSQLSFIKEYSFSQLESIYFYNNYLFACDALGVQVFDYSNPDNLVHITQYAISSAQSISIKNNIGYVATSDSFTALDLSSIMDIQFLDHYVPGDREDTEMWKIELSENLAFVLTKEFRFFDYSRVYGGYLYIFDVTSPSNVKRVYPRRIPLVTNEWALGLILYILLPAIGGSLLIVSTIFIILAIKKRKGKKKLE